ncbi:DMBT1 protein, partial [Rhynochetos jubatus]|nr:DMBT1 protein [Rhynochetos jubatus]
RCAGRLEVFWEQQWGTVCDDSWNLLADIVVCRQLDCGSPLPGSGSAQFGQGTGRIWLDDVVCNGMEDDLSACRTKPWGEHNCNHEEDVRVVCSVCFSFFNVEINNAFKLQLVNGPSLCVGRVEVLYSQHWGTPCGDKWDITDVEVVCWQLGCG